MHSVQRIQGVVRQLEVAGRTVEGGGCEASIEFKGNQKLQVWMCSIPRMQGAVGQPEVGGRRVEGLDAQHPEDYTLFWIQPLRAQATKVYLF